MTMPFMESYFEEQRVYAASLKQSIVMRLDLMRCINEKISENYEKYINKIDAIDNEVQTEINEWQEDQEIPTQEKIDYLVVELLLDTKVKNPFDNKPKKVPFASIIDKWIQQEQN